MGKEILLQLAKVTITGVGEDGGAGADTLKTDVASIISKIIAALAIVCVVVIIIGGVNYMTSAGDSGKVKKGKDTILYGCIGLIICALAFAITNFVANDVLGGGDSSSSSAPAKKPAKKPAGDVPVREEK